MIEERTASALDAEQAELWSEQLGLYADVLAGRTDAVDARIAVDATLWDSEHEPLVRGLDGLAAVRAARPTGGGSPGLVALDASEPVIDIWGDTALLRHRLTVRFDHGDDQRLRVTGVWRRSEDRWQAVHNHEDVLPRPPHDEELHP